MERLLGIPVIPTVAISGKGVYQLVEKSVEIIERGGISHARIEYGEEVEERIRKIAETIEKARFKYPSRWTAIKLLEGD